MSHKLQLHLLLDHISAKITANAAIGLRSLANHIFVANSSLCVWELGVPQSETDIFWGLLLEWICQKI